MKTTLPLLFAMLVSTCIVAQNKPIRIAAIPHELAWDNLPATSTITSESIRFAAGKETDIYTSGDASYYVNNVPKLLFKPDSNFIFSAKLKPDFKNTYDGAAIMVYSDKENWAKLLFEKNEDGSLGLGASFVKDKHGDDSYHGSFKANEVYVKVVKSGNTFCFYYATDGKTWKLVRTFPYDVLTNLRIGFYAQSPKGPGLEVTISEVRYKSEKFKNFFTGE